MTRPDRVSLRFPPVCCVTRASSGTASPDRFAAPYTCVPSPQISATDYAERTIHQLEPVRNIFAALFLASIGLIMNPLFLWNHIDILFASLLVVVTAKVPSNLPPTPHPPSIAYCGPGGSPAKSQPLEGVTCTD
eukprot:9483030-Pyramimonas_sp.AAC.3